MWLKFEFHPRVAVCLPYVIGKGSKRKRGAEGAGLRWRPLPQAEAPTEPTGETVPYGALRILVAGG